MQKAKSAPTKKGYLKNDASDEILELALAWARNEITTGQAAAAIHGEKNKKYSSNNTLYQLCIALREAVKEGKIKVEIKEK